MNSVTYGYIAKEPELNHLFQLKISGVFTDGLKEVKRVFGSFYPINENCISY